MGRLFGTDGVRGVANVDLTPELALRLGRAAAHLLSPAGGGQFLVGRDTRLSGPMLEAALVAAICSAGGQALRGGILPTPAVAYLTRRLGATAGVVISASHNPVEDNGIKFFGRDGFKLPDAVEDAIEALLDSPDLRRAVGLQVGRAEDIPEAADLYVDHLAALAVAPAAGLRVVVDCAHGAACRTVPALWEALGATVIPINDTPDGARINVRCGSTHPDVVAQAVRDRRADVGFAHDGDADRVIAVDETGAVVDGDGLLAICALHLHARGRLPGARVVATVMSNLGLERALRRAGITLERTRVGDRYVLERMRQVGATVGGEQSGHIIFLDHATTGDGALTAVQVVNVMLQTGKRLSELAAVVERLPQVLVNVAVADRAALDTRPAIARAVADAQRALGERGRVLVRASGTEPLVRIMVEAEDAAQAASLADHLADVVARELGGRRLEAPRG
ncbi:MAG: phosphoglucosamine mutase [Armatimonadota bacterium]|nr:phosphoglucosamine mutase [Armatimonadota bacterium]MDR7437324.1 phosphoglucosamine mutase [Armatimonadota bacterium]MDR7472663.1 phosphoglucosamine mutase [Armatimonadota bacterium]MDR7507753.1 phosphoglucosamine mutase [Armatimonadota bacterium]MDR7509048.1 phosphoglucosamine mutase [Armatimonadota bacterium]